MKCSFETEFNMILFNTCHQYEAFQGHTWSKRPCRLKEKHSFLPYAHGMFGSWNRWILGGDVDYSAWILTILGVNDSNLTYIFWFQLFAMEVKNFEETRGKFSAWNQTQKFFDLKWNEFQFKMPNISRLMVTSLKILIANTTFQMHFRHWDCRWSSQIQSPVGKKTGTFSMVHKALSNTDKINS